MIGVQKYFDKNIDKMFNVVVDLTERPKMDRCITSVENISTKLPQVGTVHSCVLPKGANILVTSYFSRDAHSIVLEETDKRKIGTSQIMLEQVAEDKTSMSFNFYVKKNLVFPVLFKLFIKKKLQGAIERSLDKLKVYMDSIEVAN